MAAQVLDVEHLEPGALHLDQRVGEARDPSAGEDVLADEELGVVAADVADEVQHAEPARLEAGGMRAHHLGQLVAAGVLEHADRHQLVVGAVGVAEVGLAHRELLLQAAARDLPAQPVDLFGRGVDAGAERARGLERAEHEAAEAAADVDVALARREAQLAADVVDLLPLRLLQRARALGPVAAGVHQQRLVQPQPVEGGAEAVVLARVGLGLRRRGVRVAPFVQVVLERVPGSVLQVEPGHHRRGEGGAEVALDVDGLVEVGLEQPDVAAREGGEERGVAAEDDAEGRRAGAAGAAAAVRQLDGEGHAGAAAEFVDERPRRAVRTRLPPGDAGGHRAATLGMPTRRAVRAMVLSGAGLRRL